LRRPTWFRCAAQLTEVGNYPDIVACDVPEQILRPSQKHVEGLGYDVDLVILRGVARRIFVAEIRAVAIFSTSTWTVAVVSPERFSTSLGP
jgi:hypothetical protein